MRESYQIRVHLIEARSLKGISEAKGFSVSPQAKVQLIAGEGANKIDVTKHSKTGAESNSVFWNEVIIFQEQLTRDAFNTGKMEVRIEDVGYFANSIVGTSIFDLSTIYEHPNHELFGKWCVVMDEERGTGLTGFLRLSVTVLREGDVPKIHSAKDLEQDLEPDIGLVINLPDLETEAFLLTVIINKVEVAPFGLDTPTMQVRIRFGATEIKSRVLRRGFEQIVNDELRFPIYQPTLTDRISIEIIDTKKSNSLTGAEFIICRCTLSAKDVTRDALQTHWENMYGVRPLPKVSLLGQIGRFEDESAESTAYRGRIMLYAACEIPKPEESLAVMRLPRIFSKAELDTLTPRVQDYALRCDLYDASDIPCGAFQSCYVVVALGPHERTSTKCQATDGVVRFESDQPGKENYYEQLEELRAKMPDDPQQQYDIFVHVYIETEFGAKRVGYKRFATEPFLRVLEDEGAPDEPPQPTWYMLIPDPLYTDSLEVVSSMIQFSLIFGPQKIVDTIPRKRMRIAKLKHYELTAKIYQAQGLVPSDDNGLADPYVRIGLSGASKETQTIHASLNPIWYEPLTIRAMLPGNLDLAPKITISVYDADPAPLNLNSLKEFTREYTDGVIARALAPPGKFTRTIREYYNRPLSSIKPEWIELHDPKEANLDKVEEMDDDADEPPPFGKILCSFELRPHQPAAEEKKGSRKSKSDRADVPLLGESSSGVSRPAGSLRPETEPYLIEMSVVGCRDMMPREIMGVPVELQAPYVEFEYGDMDAEERVWRTRTAAAAANPASSTATQVGPHVNLLETMYLRVELPKDIKTFEPIMGVRVRESARVKLPFGLSEDPIMGITSIDLLKEMPEYQELKRQENEEKEAKVQAEADEKARELQKKEQEGAFGDQLDKIDQTPNTSMLDELFLSSALKTASNTRSGALKQKELQPGQGERTIENPETQELGAEEEEEDEGEEEEDIDFAEPTVLKPLEDTLPDKPFKLFPLSTKPPEPAQSEQAASFWQRGGEAIAELQRYAIPLKFEGTKKTTGLLKMKVRVIKVAGSEEFLRDDPPQNLKKMYAERPCKVRVYVYSAASLSPRANGGTPQPFLKVYNVPDRVRTTRDTAVAPSLEPEFYSSFEIAALLPGQSRLHIEVWDYQLLSESLIGETIIDLEDRLFSKEWQQMQIDGALPREIRPLQNPGNVNNQGFLTVKVEIVERKFAIANPMIPIETPTFDVFDLRIIVWDAVDVKAKDESFFGGGGTSDVFITIQPIGRETYNMQKTDVHNRSPGDAEFNWRMCWPMLLPERAPKLFLQVWDADLLSANDAIGEAQLTLKPLCDKALKRGGSFRLENVFVPTTHPNFKGNQGTVRLTIELLVRAEALQKPVGLGREAPNQYPFLATPIRPSLFDGLGIDFNFLNPFYLFKKYGLCCCICCVIAAAVYVFIMLNSPTG